MRTEGELLRSLWRKAGCEMCGMRGALIRALVRARDGWFPGETVQSGAGETTTAAEK